jgi:hypothetical protein
LVCAYSLVTDRAATDNSKELKRVRLEICWQR